MPHLDLGIGISFFILYPDVSEINKNIGNRYSSMLRFFTVKDHPRTIYRWMKYSCEVKKSRMAGSPIMKGWVGKSWNAANKIEEVDC
jgi:hypothetical protein